MAYQLAFNWPVDDIVDCFVETVSPNLNSNVLNKGSKPSLARTVYHNTNQRLSPDKPTML
jgi:hypothetical protein